MPKSVCIIGAGPAGLAAARAFTQPSGAFQVTLFEKSYRPGGLWPLTETDEGLINPDMTTNISRFLVAFGDKAWPADAPLFPKAYQVGQYLHRYIDTYLAKAVDIRYSCPVKAISEPKPGSEDTQWRVRVSNRQGEVAVEEEHRFDHVIISSGFFGKAKIASYIHQGLDQNVPVVHSTAFRHIKDLLKNVKKPGKIVVVGGSISGAETAARVADQLSTEMYSPQQSSIQNVDQFSVHHIGRQPFWTFPRLLSPDVTITGKDESEKKFNPAPTFLPADFVMFNLVPRLPDKWQDDRSGVIPPEGAQRSHLMFETLNGGQANPFMWSESDSRGDAPWIGITDNYSFFVQSKAITPIRGQVTNVDQERRSVVFKAKNAEEALDDVAAVIFATGFDVRESVSFLSDALKGILGYDAETMDYPLDLSLQSIVHPAVQHLGFVGFYRGAYWAVAEMQARTLRALWDDSTDPSIRASILGHLDGESRIRFLREMKKQQPKQITQFPMGDYIHIMEDLRTTLGFPQEKKWMDQLRLTEPCIPARYTQLAKESCQLDEATANEIARQLSLAKETIQESRKGRLVARAIFRSLQGNWSLDRRIKSNISTYPSGKLTGTAKFHPRIPTDAAFDGEYLFVEDGEFETETGLTFRATRRYVYRYAEITDVLSVWFVKADGKTVDYLFHELNIHSPHVARDHETTAIGEVKQEPQNFSSLKAPHDRRWTATSHHLCIDDTYDPEYEFVFRGVDLAKWSVGYSVKGPHKDYWIGSTFTR